MTTVRELHDKAMELAHRALVARHNDQWDEASSLARQALLFERQAAELVPLIESSEPTRSILYRSAASLAYQCRDYKSAQRLIAQGLSGYPPLQVEKELQDLYEQVKFESDLLKHRVSLANEELEISLQGSGVGYGTILYDEFVRRLKSTRTLIDRTVQRMSGAPYKSSGRVSKNLRPFTHTLSTPRPGSFSIIIRLAVDDGEQLPLLLSPAEVIQEMLRGIELVNSGNDAILRESIPQEAYYRNFVALTKDIAPDGDRIRFVSFTGSSGITSLTRPRSQIEVLTEEDKETPQLALVEIAGVLDYASARKQKEAVGLTTDEGIEYTVFLHEGLDDLVRSYFGQSVIVIGELDPRGRNISPVDIRADIDN
jgi:hypothetical protein